MSGGNISLMLDEGMTAPTARNSGGKEAGLEQLREHGDTEIRWGQTGIPGVFNAAGLMVPEPSFIIPPPIPFIEDETGCDVEYMSNGSCASISRLPRTPWRCRTVALVALAV